MFLSIGMLKQNYFLADIFILSAEKQPIKLSWRKIECLQKTSGFCLFAVEVSLCYVKMNMLLYLNISTILFSSFASITPLCRHNCFPFLKIMSVGTEDIA